MEQRFEPAFKSILEKVGFDPNLSAYGGHGERKDFNHYNFSLLALKNNSKAHEDMLDEFRIRTVRDKLDKELGIDYITESFETGYQVSFQASVSTQSNYKARERRAFILSTKKLKTSIAHYFFHGIEHPKFCNEFIEWGIIDLPGYRRLVALNQIKFNRTYKVDVEPGAERDQLIWTTFEDARQAGVLSFYGEYK